MMPSDPGLRNRARGGGGLLAGVLAVCACAPAVELEIALQAALEPDPFDEVRLLRVVAATPAGPEELGRTRWDQGPIDLPAPLPLDASRVWVEGLDEAGRVRSFGASAPLELSAAPEDRLQILFARVGVLSVVPGRVGARAGWRAGALGAEGVLLLGGRAGGALPETTLRVDARGALRPGPRLPGGRAGAAVASAGGRLVVWGGEDDAGPAARFVVLDLEGGARAGMNPIDPSTRPAVVPSDGRRALVVNRASAEVAEIDVADVRGRRIGRLDAAPRGGAVARFRRGQVVAVGGRGLPSAAVFDARTSTLLGGRVPLAGPRLGGAARTTAALSTVVAGGTHADGRPARGVSTLRWPLPLAETGTRSTFLPALAPGPARLHDAGGGTLLLVPASGALRRLELGRGRVTEIPAPPAPFDLAPHPDGTLRGVADDGALLAFAPGPSSFVPNLETGAGLVPRRPEGWRADGTGVVGTAARPALPGADDPAAWAVLGALAFEDFGLELDVTPIERGRAALLFDFDETGYDVLVLQRAARIRAGPGRAPVGCPAAEVAGLDEGSGTTRIRFSRRGAEVRLDVGADGAVELACEVPGRAPGRLALAVLAGSVRFSRLVWSGPLGARAR